MKTISLFLVSVCSFQLGFTQHLLTDQPLRLNPSFAGSNNVARFNLASTIEGNSFSYDQFIPKLKGGIGISANLGLRISPENFSFFGVYSPKFTSSRKYSVAPSLAIGYDESYFGNFMLGRLGLLLNTAKFYAGAFIETKYTYSLLGDFHFGKKVEINKNMSFALAGYYSIESIPDYVPQSHWIQNYLVQQGQISLRMKYKSLKLGVGLIGKKISYDVLPTILSYPEVFFKNVLFSVGYERKRWSIDLALTPTAFSALNYSQYRFDSCNLGLTYSLHKKKEFGQKDLQ